MNKRIIKIFVNCLLIISLLLQTGCVIKFNHSDSQSESTKEKVITTEKMYAKEGCISYENDATCFSRNNILNSNEKIIYDEIYTGLLAKKTTIGLDNIGGNFESQSQMKDIIKNAVFSVLRDHPQFFMYKGVYTFEFNYDLLVSSVSIEFETLISDEEAINKQKEIDEVVNKLLNAVKDMDEYNKSKYVYKYLAQNTTYEESENAHNMYGCLVEGVSVCEGYAKAYNYIMQKCGMDVAYVTGMGKNESHAWNLIKINGDWYHVDCTWGDPKTEIKDPEEKRLNVDYSYLHLTTDDILINHALDDFYKNLPLCTAIDANYYVMEAEYLTSYSDTDLSNIIKNKISADNDSEINISIRYAVPSDVKKANKWLEDGYIKNAVKNVGYSSFTYSWSYTDVGTIDINLLFKF